MDTERFHSLAKEALVEKIAESFPDEGITVEDIYVVWTCKTLQNNKAMLSTDKLHGNYYEVTHNGDKKQLYVDIYEKVSNTCINYL